MEARGARSPAARASAMRWAVVRPTFSQKGRMRIQARASAGRARGASEDEEEGTEEAEEEEVKPRKKRPPLAVAGDLLHKMGLGPEMRTALDKLA